MYAEAERSRGEGRWRPHGVPDKRGDVVQHPYGGRPWALQAG